MVLLGLLFCLQFSFYDRALVFHILKWLALLRGNWEPSHKFLYFLDFLYYYIHLFAPEPSYPLPMLNTYVSFKDWLLIIFTYTWADASIFFGDPGVSCMTLGPHWTLLYTVIIIWKSFGRLKQLSSRLVFLHFVCFKIKCVCTCSEVVETILEGSLHHFALSQIYTGFQFLHILSMAFKVSNSCINGCELLLIFLLSTALSFPYCTHIICKFYGLTFLI